MQRAWTSLPHQWEEHDDQAEIRLGQCQEVTAEPGLLGRAAAVEKHVHLGNIKVILGEVDVAVVGHLGSVSGCRPPCQPPFSAGSPAP